MSDPQVFRLNEISVLDLVGADADAIFHNLTTNDVKALGKGQGCETFVTNVRGKTVGHVQAFRIENGFRLVGAAGQSQQISDHADRYTIREDATPEVRDDQYAAFVLNKHSIGLIAKDLGLGDIGTSQQCTYSSNDSCTAYCVPWLGESSWLLLTEPSRTGEHLKLCESKGIQPADDASFHAARVSANFPWFGVDLNEKNLPQEADRNDQTISFTKGCYLGQETVARLDAMGQVQKKLVCWSIPDCVPDPNAELMEEGKVVGRLTSVAAVEGGALAIGMARRSHFDAGSVATGTITGPDSGKTFAATVV